MIYMRYCSIIWYIMIHELDHRSATFTIPGDCWQCSSVSWQQLRCAGIADGVLELSGALTLPTPSLPTARQQHVSLANRSSSAKGALPGLLLLNWSTLMQSHLEMTREIAREH